MSIQVATQQRLSKPPRWTKWQQRFHSTLNDALVLLDTNFAMSYLFVTQSESELFDRQRCQIFVPNRVYGELRGLQDNQCSNTCRLAERALAVVCKLADRGIAHIDEVPKEYQVGHIGDQAIIELVNQFLGMRKIAVLTNDKALGNAVYAIARVVRTRPQMQVAVIRADDRRARFIIAPRPCLRTAAPLPKRNL